MPTNEEEKGEKEDAVDGGTADTGVDQLRQRLQQQQQQCLVKERTMSVGPLHGQQKEDASMAQVVLLCLSLLTWTTSFTNLNRKCYMCHEKIVTTYLGMNLPY